MLIEYIFKSLKYNLIRIKSKFIKRILKITLRFGLILKRYLNSSKLKQSVIK